MSDLKLAPCPTGCREFAGVDVEPSGSVVCNGCGFRAPDIGTWNTRAPSPAVRALVEACRTTYSNMKWSREIDWRAFDNALAAVEKEIGA